MRLDPRSLPDEIEVEIIPDLEPVAAPTRRRVAQKLWSPGAGNNPAAPPLFVPDWVADPALLPKRPPRRL